MSTQPGSTLASRLVLLACFTSSLTYAADADSKPWRWPAFQGVGRSSLVAAQLPLEWSPTKNVAWKAEIKGYGQSSPVVWGSLACVTSVSGDMKEHCHVTAIDLESGQIRWQQTIAAASQVENSNYVSKGAPTPTADARGFVVFFESGNLLALDFEGKLRWQRNLVEEHGAIASRHGLGGSLSQTDEAVFLWVERQDDPYLLAINKSDGKTRWKSPGLGATSWSTPTMIRVGGATQLVLSGGGKLAGYDPQTGNRLWSLENLSGNSVPTPQPAGDGKILLGATVARGEEGGGRAAASNGLIAVSASSPEAYSAKMVWNCQRATSSFGSPIVHQGLAYFVNATGVLFCVDAESGKELYAERIGDSLWATPLAVDDRIYLAGRSGTTVVVQAGREFRKLAENHLFAEVETTSVESKSAETKSTPAKSAEVKTKSESHKSGGENSRGRPQASSGPIQYAIAAVGDRILMRTGSAVYCLRNSQ